MDTQQAKKMNALNRAFEKAFAHVATRETLLDLLSCLGEELECERISIFEKNIEETFDNTYEWCRPGVVKEIELLQGIPLAELDTWKNRLLQDELLVFQDLEDIKRSDPDVYEMFHSQGVYSIIVSRMAFHGKGLGFFAIENPAPGTLEDADIFLPGMRYIISSLVYSDHLVRRLEKIGYTDRLTGAGNRMSLQEHLEALNPLESLGIIYLEVLGWKIEDERLEHRKDEQKLLRTGQILADLFGEDLIFRVGGSEFLVTLTGISATLFEEQVRLLKNMLAEHDLSAAVGRLWQADCSAPDGMIRQAHLLEFSERKELLKAREEKAGAAMHRDPEEKDRANITLLREDAFFHQAEEFVSGVFDQPVLTAVIDINYFKLYNDIFGRMAGNLLLEGMAQSLEEQAERLGGVAGYLGGDNFCLMVPVPVLEENRLRPFIDRLYEKLKYADGFTPAMGIYISFDRQETMITMYDRALTPLQEIKGSYMEHYRFYDAGHFRHQREDKLLLMDIRNGLPRGEFTFYLQPQVNERTELIVGAEVLVRWNKDGQVIMPGRFIPLLEKTGYIFPLDCYIWEEAARWLRSLLDRGITPVPCSVNVSRVDFYFTDIAKHFIDLVRKYDLPPDLLGIEITESAFTDNIDVIMDSVQRLHEAGFRLLMDDFGSGSSSLSMLHTMHLDVLKTDVRFMSRMSADTRAVSIVESVISMAHMIGMMVVTEGVETQEQRDNLIAIGDNYAQGFYFYHPMPKTQFEEILKTPGRLGKSFRFPGNSAAGHIGFRTLIRDGLVSDTLLDNIIGPAAVYMEKDGAFSLVQVNEQYAVLTGFSPEDEEESCRFSENFRKDSHHADIVSIIRGVDTHPLEGSGGRVILTRKDGKELDLETRVYLLYSCESYRLYLSILHV